MSGVVGRRRSSGRYGREDQYEAEALWHVRRRNFGMDADRKGDPAELDIAWHENLILERHFTAVLDAASAGGAAGHRLAPEQLADVDARRAHGRSAVRQRRRGDAHLCVAVPAFWSFVARRPSPALAAAARPSERRPTM